jgi:prepilin-type N-terminal cleavage/methylation domain-containing protein
MKNPTNLKSPRGFTLLETVIAIGVLAVLLTGFMVVFAPAAAGIRQSINVQQADRLASALEQELVTFRKGDESGLPNKTNYTGFDKAFDWILDSSKNSDAILVYQYRGQLSGYRADGTPEPETNVQNKLPGENYVVVPMARRKSDPRFNDDLKAIEGSVYLVKCTQLVFGSGSAGLTLGKPGEIKDPKGSGGAVDNADDYPEAVVAFAAEFHMLPSKAESYFNGAAFTKRFNEAKNPVFTRNLAVRR